MLAKVDRRYTKQRRNPLLSSIVVRVVILIILAWHVRTERLESETMELVIDNILDIPTPATKQNFIWNLLRGTTLGQAGDVIKHSQEKTREKVKPSNMFRKKSGRMSLTDLADLLSSLKQRYEANVNMRMPSLRFGK